MPVINLQSLPDILDSLKILSVDLKLNDLVLLKFIGQRFVYYNY